MLLIAWTLRKKRTHSLKINVFKNLTESFPVYYSCIEIFQNRGEFPSLFLLYIIFPFPLILPHTLSICLSIFFYRCCNDIKIKFLKISNKIHLYIFVIYKQELTSTSPTSALINLKNLTYWIFILLDVYISVSSIFFIARGKENDNSNFQSAFKSHEFSKYLVSFRGMQKRLWTAYRISSRIKNIINDIPSLGILMSTRNAQDDKYVCLYVSTRAPL